MVLELKAGGIKDKRSNKNAFFNEKVKKACIFDFFVVPLQRILKVELVYDSNLSGNTEVP